jgi:tetratricopeptide (TPR) repeat protein
MLGFGWLTVRQAQEALKNGRLEEAQRLLGQPLVHGHKRSWEVAREIANAYIERGERQLRQDNSEGAWHDLLQAEQLGGSEPTASKLRGALVRLGLAEVRAQLQAGEPARALESVSRLRERSVQHPELQVLEEAARGWQQSREQANRGEFRLALESLDWVRRQLPNAATTLEQLQKDLELRQKNFTTLLVKLHEAANELRWREVVEVSEQVLAIAPHHPEARKTRALAWKAIEPVTLPIRERPARPMEEPEPEPLSRFLLWIDGVGGYLVCLGSRITLGQATPDTTVDVPLLADVSRFHAVLTRDSEGYLFEASRNAAVNTRSVQRTLLRPGDRITLGSACQLQFQQPSPISTSARLELVSGHRLPLAVDAVLLMADTLLLGPGTQVHVAMPDLKQPLVLYRHKSGVGVRWSGSLTIDGQPCQERGLLGPNSRVQSDDFTFAIEPVGTRMGRA